MTKTPRTSKKKITIKDLGAFETMYKNLALPVTKFIIKRVGGKEETVEEIFSQTISAALKGWNTFENKSTYYTWLCKIAIYKIADYYRKEVNTNSRLVAPLLEEIANVESNDLSPEEQLSLKELQRNVKECLNLLPKEKQKLLYLRFWKELSIKEISKLLGISERATEGKIYRAKKLLAKTVNEEYPETAKIYHDSNNR